jgi:alkylated DNA repair dioxygenase AlkB
MAGLGKEEEGVIMITLQQVLTPMGSTTPKFALDQQVIDGSGLYAVDTPGCYLMLQKSFLAKEERQQYLEKAVEVQRFLGRAGFGPKPRAEVCYTADGESFVYSNISHKTIKYPEHVSFLIPKMLECVDKHCLSKRLPRNTFTMPSHAIDIVYNNAFPRGGSVSAHGDNEQPWGLVTIMSFGQTRWLRVRNHTTKKFYNVKMMDNSLVAMIGETFQHQYSHQVDKLKENEPIGTRLSLNIRYLKQPHVSPQEDNNKPIVIVIEDDEDEASPTSKRQRIE